MSFDKDYPEISTSELWKIFTEKAGDDSAFITAVEEICKHGADLSKSIICFFPTFTLHDTTHIDGVCRWMVRLLGDRKNDLTAEEAAVLLMTACCHDIGMSVSVEYKNELKKQLKAHFSGNYMERWGAYFKKYPEDELAYRDTNELSDQMLRRYIRDNHHNRIEKQLPKDWPDALSKKYITRDDIVRLCRSHGLSLPDGGFRSGDPYKIDYNICAVLLRLADLFDYDALRAPQSLFMQLGLDKPDTPERKKSREEWKKNGAGFFGDVKDGKILYRATFYDPQIEHEVQSYIDWANAELSSCESFISRFAGRWQNFRPPYRVKTDYKRIGYEAGDFHLTMDQDKIIRLLAGESIYNDPGVFVRELLQNAIDAVLYRRKLDRRFGEDEGLITIYTWDDSEGYTWFRIEDNGTGMDEHIVKEYMLKVGRSYYTSDEYRAEARNAERDTGFKPTSRFGIGILSCFMSDPEETTVEVLTKRYSSNYNNPNKAIRLNISGLHGYYYLTKTDEDHPGQPMHCPPGMEGENDNYLRGTGTTICVGVSRYKRGGQFSFKEVLDHYVMFPEVRVRYIDSEFPEGFDYPTQKELMDVVHRLNEGSEETKEYIHPLPDDLFEQLKTASPIMNWNETNRPEIVFRYHPLDVLASSQNTTGVIMTINLRWSEVSCSKIFEINGECYTPKLKGIILKDTSTGNLILDFSYMFSDDYGEDDAIIRNLAKMDKTFEFSADDLNSTKSIRMNDIEIKKQKAFIWKNQLNGFDLYLSCDGLFRLLSDDEKRILTWIGYKEAVAYNGVGLQNRYFRISKHSYGNYSPFVVLLRGENYPEVTLSRSRISSLPLSALCEIYVIIYRIIRFSDYDSIIVNIIDHKNKYLFSEDEFFAILNRHEAWKEWFGYRDKCLSEIKDDILVEDIMCDIGKIYNRYLLFSLKLAMLKQKFKVSFDFEDCKGFRVSEKVSEETSCFPVEMFFYPEGISDFFGCVLELFEITGSYYSGIVYNAEHRFSRWLIHNRRELINKVPRYYEEVISVMVRSHSPEDIINSLNKILKRLAGFPGNPFDVTSELYLKPDEIRKQEQEEEDDE